MRKKVFVISTNDLRALERLKKKKTQNGFMIGNRIFHEVNLPSCFTDWFICLATQDVTDLCFRELWNELLKTKNGDAVITLSSIIADKYSLELYDELSAHTYKLPSRARKCLIEIAKSGFEELHSDEYLERADENDLADKGIWEAIYIKLRAQ